MEQVRVSIVQQKELLSCFPGPHVSVFSVPYRGVTRLEEVADVEENAVRWKSDKKRGVVRENRGGVKGKKRNTVMGETNGRRL